MHVTPELARYGSKADMRAELDRLRAEQLRDAGSTHGPDATKRNRYHTGVAHGLEIAERLIASWQVIPIDASPALWEVLMLTVQPCDAGCDLTDLAAVLSHLQNQEDATPADQAAHLVYVHHDPLTDAEQANPGLMRAWHAQAHDRDLEHARRRP